MNNQTTQARVDIVRRYRHYGLWGGATLGAIVGFLVSGPHFHEWATAQSLAVIVGFTAGIAMIGYLFLTLVLGASAGAGTEGDGHEYGRDSEKTETTGIAVESANDGD